MNIYNKLSTEYDTLYKANIQNFQANLNKEWNTDGYFVDFYPSLGISKDQDCDLMFYGQAVNGWPSGFNLREVISDSKVRRSTIVSNRYFQKLDHCPLDWVNVRWSNSIFDSITADSDASSFYNDGGRYRTFRSFFWKVSYKLTCDLYGLSRDSWDWAKKIVWSNLYKIAEDGGNPNPYLREQQIPTSVDLLRKEIEEIRPKYCVVLTNYEWWKPFKKRLGATECIYDKSLSEIVAFEQYNDTKIIVTTRPRLGSGERHVSQLLKMIQ